MTPLDFIKIQADVLKRQDLSPTAKMLLGLVQGCNCQGLYVSNETIAELLGVQPKYVSQILNSLETKNLIEIKNRQSRYRKIYFQKNQEVEAVLLPEKTASTSRKIRNITKGTKESRHTVIAFDAERGEFSGLDGATISRWRKAYPGVNVEVQIARAADWLVRNGQTKKDYGRFLTNWLRRERPSEDVFDDSKFETNDEDIEQLRKAGIL